MTIIAYRAGVLAADGLTETDGLVVPGPPKIVRRGKAWVAAAGALGDCAAFERWVEAGSKDDEAPELDDGFEALVAAGGRVRWYDKRCAPVDVTDLPWTAIGSGHQVAAVAMAQGGSAVEACALACRMRVDCGPPVVFVDVARGGEGLRVAAEGEGGDEVGGERDGVPPEGGPASAGGRPGPDPAGRRPARARLRRPRRAVRP